MDPNAERRRALVVFIVMSVIAFGVVFIVMAFDL
jgi:hypothetical protein